MVSIWAKTMAWTARQKHWIAEKVNADEDADTHAFTIREWIICSCCWAAKLWQNISSHQYRICVCWCACVSNQFSFHTVSHSLCFSISLPLFTPNDNTLNKKSSEFAFWCVYMFLFSFSFVFFWLMDVALLLWVRS